MNPFTIGKDPQLLKGLEALERRRRPGHKAAQEADPIGIEPKVAPARSG